MPIVKENNIKIINILKEENINETIKFEIPHKIIETESYKERKEVEKFSSEYIKLKEEIKIKGM